MHLSAYIQLLLLGNFAATATIPEPNKGTLINNHNISPLPASSTTCTATTSWFMNTVTTSVAESIKFGRSINVTCEEWRAYNKKQTEIFDTKSALMSQYPDGAYKAMSREDAELKLDLLIHAVHYLNSIRS